MNWILSWNEWITQFLNRYLPFLMISPLFCLFWTLFGQFLGTFPIRPVLIIPWLLNWIIFWIESPEFILNWIIFWIESWVKQYWIEYWMNHFLAKFKYWIESDWVSFTTMQDILSQTEYKTKANVFCFNKFYFHLKIKIKKKKLINKKKTNLSHNRFWTRDRWHILIGCCPVGSLEPADPWKRYYQLSGPQKLIRCPKKLIIWR